MTDKFEWHPAESGGGIEAKAGEHTIHVFHCEIFKDPEKSKRFPNWFWVIREGKHAVADGREWTEEAAKAEAEKVLSEDK